MKKNYVILPTFNDWKSLNKLLSIIDKTLKKSKVQLTTLIINDGSTDKPVLYTNKFKNIKKIFLINLKENLGSQKAIFIGLKYLQNQIKNKHSSSIISVMDSDGEDNPKKLTKLIITASQNPNHIVFAARSKRTESLFLKILNTIRLTFTYILTGFFINFGNYSSFSIKNLKKVLSNNNLFIAYSSGVLKNCQNIFFVKVSKNKRYFGSSKVNFNFLISHSIGIIAVFYKKVFLRTLVIALVLILIVGNLNFKILIVIIFSFLNLNLLLYYKFSQPKKNFSYYIKDDLRIK